MKRFIEGEDRRQATLLPDSLEDYVTEDNPVRVIDAFINELDLGGLGFAGVVPEATGRPAYHPATLLKIYLYGYLNRIQSSRRLERETQRNIELMWLTGRLMPGFKTIADFRREFEGSEIDPVDQFPGKRAGDPRGLRAIHRAVSSVQPVHPSRRGHRREQVQGGQHPRQELHGGQARQTHRAGRDQHRALPGGPGPRRPAGRRCRRGEGTPPEGEDRGPAPTDAIAEGDGQTGQSRARRPSLAHRPRRAVPNSMGATSGKGTGIVGYNVQAAVDAEHHLIVAHEVTNAGTDRAQLTSMGRKARDATGCAQVTVLADRGYYNGDEVLACEGTGVLPCIPKTQTSGNAKRGRFTVADFIYDAGKDHYTCPAGKHLTKGKVRSDRRDHLTPTQTGLVPKPALA